MSTHELNAERLVKDLKRVVRDSEELLQASSGAVGDKADAVRKRVSETLAAAKASYRQFEEATVDGAQAADKVIREHPYHGIAVAFGVGLVVGTVLSRK